MCRIHRHLVLGLVAGLDAEFQLFKDDVEIRQDQLVLDEPQMMQVISSPSSSTTGIFTLIFAVLSSSREVSRVHRDRQSRKSGDIRTRPSPEQAPVATFSCNWPHEMLIQRKR